jgi:hypothetical protein
MQSSQNREIETCGHEWCGTRNQDRLWWRGPAAINRTGRATYLEL